MRSVTIPHDSVCRRGAVVVLVAVSLVLILGFGALAIDLGQLYLARAELQRAADAAALGGATAYFTDAGLAQDVVQLENMIIKRAQNVSLQNPTHHVDTVLEAEDVVIGTYDPNHPEAGLDTSRVDRLNAVQVTVRRTPESTNGSISLYLAGVLGIREASVTATATAMANSKFSGLEVTDEAHPPLIPLTLNVDLYDFLAESGADDYSYEDDAIHEEGDGVYELNLYSWRINTNDPDNPFDDELVLSDQGAGNFALLNFDAVNIYDTWDNIVNGLSAEQLIAEFGTAVVQYCTEAGEPITYELDGEAGLRVWLSSAFTERVGDVVGIFVHDQITEYSGADGFRNVGIRFGRIMAADLVGTDNKRLVFQPVAYSGPDVIIDEEVPDTGGQLGRIVLVK